MCHYWGNCDTFGAILDLLGQCGALLGQFVAVLEDFIILIYRGIYAFVYKGFNDFVIQASMLSYTGLNDFVHIYRHK